VAGQLCPASSSPNRARTRQATTVVAVRVAVFLAGQKHPVSPTDCSVFQLFVASTSARHSELTPITELPMSRRQWSLADTQR
jgi:hypothetical protein